jgi:transposase
MIQSIERGGPALPLHVVLPHEGTLGSLRILAGAERTRGRYFAFSRRPPQHQQAPRSMFTMPRIPYPTVVSDAEWAILEVLLPAAKRRGRPRADLRQAFNAIRYVTRSGAQWRMVPHDLVPWGTAWSYFRRWREDGTWQRLYDVERADVRSAAWS